jgi:hypothetical protein
LKRRFFALLDLGFTVTRLILLHPEVQKIGRILRQLE